MDEKYKKSLSEVYEILKLMPESILNKIPQKLKDIIKNERDIEYTIIVKEPLTIEDFQYETIVLLGMIYRDFLCDENEKNILKQREIDLANQYDEEIRKMYNPDDLFNRRKKANIGKSESLPIKVEEDRKWFKKIFELVKGVFK